MEMMVYYIVFHDAIIDRHDDGALLNRMGALWPSKVG